MVIFVVSSTPMYVPWVLVIGVRAVRSPVTKVLEHRWDLKLFGQLKSQTTKDLEHRWDLILFGQLKSQRF